MKPNNKDFYYEEREAYKLFQEDPQRWEEVIVKSFTHRQAQIILSFYRDKKPVKTIKSEIKVSRAWLYTVLLRADKMINRLSSEKKGEEVIVKPIINKSGVKNRLTQEEFDEIKDLLYQGYETHDIIERMTKKRSVMVITKVRKATNLEDYFQKQKDYYKSMEVSYENNLEIPPPLLPQENIKGALLIQIEQTRQKLTTLIEEYLTLEVKELLGEVNVDGVLENIKKKYLS